MENTENGKALFIAGTDTGVGKTIVSAGLIALAEAAGLTVSAVKPIETGCVLKEGRLYPEDGAFLCAAAGGSQSIERCVPYTFELPAAPATAARAEGRSIISSNLIDHIRTETAAADLTVIEGAGGLMVPINPELMMIDLAERIGFPVVLVGRSSLGTLNHTLLSMEALARRIVTVSAIILSQSNAQKGPEEEYTPGDLERYVGDIPVLVLPHLDPESSADPEAIARIMSKEWPGRIIKKLLGM